MTSPYNAFTDANSSDGGIVHGVFAPATYFDDKNEHPIIYDDDPWLRGDLTYLYNISSSSIELFQNH